MKGEGGGREEGARNKLYTVYCTEQFSHVLWKASDSPTVGKKKKKK